MTATNEGGGCWPSLLQEKLLQAALCDGETARSAWQSWRSTVEIEHLEHVSHRLLPLLAHSLARQGVTLNEDDKAFFVRAARETWFKNQMLLARGATLIRDLEASGIATLVFKGAALTLQFYSNFSLRPMNDFDILVPSHQAKRAYNWALENGWKFDVETDPALLTDVFLENLHGQGFRNAQGQSFDLHKRLLHHDTEPDTDFWDASLPLEIHGVTTKTLCASDHLLTALSHGVRWEENAPLRWVADAMTILRVAPEQIDWNRVLEQTRKRQMHLPVQAGLQYLKTTFEAPIPATFLEEVARIPVTPTRKLEFRGWTTSHQTHHPLMRFYLRYVQFSRREISRGWRGKVFGLPLYLQHAWHLRSPWELPFFVYKRGLRQLRAHLHARFRQAK